MRKISFGESFEQQKRVEMSFCPSTPILKVKSQVEGQQDYFLFQLFEKANLEKYTESIFCKFESLLLEKKKKKKLLPFIQIMLWIQVWKQARLKSSFNLVLELEQQFCPERRYATVKSILCKY